MVKQVRMSSWLLCIRFSLKGVISDSFMLKLNVWTCSELISRNLNLYIVASGDRVFRKWLFHKESEFLSTTGDLIKGLQWPCQGLCLLSFLFLFCKCEASVSVLLVVSSSLGWLCWHHPLRLAVSSNIKKKFPINFPVCGVLL